MVGGRGGFRRLHQGLLIERSIRFATRLSTARLGERDVDRELIAYGDELLASDRSPIPDYDLPAGAPPWWSSVRQWAARKGDTAEEKRATIEVVVPTAERPWR